MPRVFFTGRRKISQDEVSLHYHRDAPPRFIATIDLGKHRRTLPLDAKVIIEAHHNTMIQRFDFGTLADCRAREPLELTRFEASDSLRFRLRVVDVSKDVGAVLASCERINAVDHQEGGGGGRSMLKLFPKPNSEMRGELWRIENIGGGYQLCYNNDVPWLKQGIQTKDPYVHGLVLPSAFRNILEREMLWDDPDMSNEWIGFAQSITGEAPPTPERGEGKDDVEDWIDGVIATFSLKHGRFIEQINAMEAG